MDINPSVKTPGALSLNEEYDPNRPENKPDISKMEYRYLGNTGTRVSILGYGNWANNDNKELTLESVKLAIEKGVNYFDTAEVYGLGRGELTLGHALKTLNIPREKIIVSSKIFRNDKDPNDTFLSRKHIHDGIKKILKRLQLEYIDILYAHRYDMRTPLEETCRTMNNLINQGKIIYWGTSNWTACQIIEAHKICEKYNFVPPVVEQCQYSMMMRQSMEEYRDLFKQYGFRCTTFSPLYSGVLTGKYLKEIPNDSRYVTTKEAIPVIKFYFDNKHKWDKKIIQLMEVAKKLECTISQLAIAWVLKNPDVSSCILGATKIKQLQEDLGALEVYKKLDHDILVEIEKILDNAPRGEIDYSNWVELPSRRNQNLDIDYVKKQAFN